MLRNAFRSSVVKAQRFLMGRCEWGNCLSCYQECGESPLKPLKTSAAGLPFYFPSSHLFLGTDKFGRSQKRDAECW